MSWLDVLGTDPRTWLLTTAGPGVRAAALQALDDRPADDADVLRARVEATATEPVAGVLSAQHPDGWWEKPGPGYSPKYLSTVWQVQFLAQLEADPEHPSVQAGCRYVLDHALAVSGGFGSSGVRDGPPPRPHRVIHCLNGNLVAALVRLGAGDDPRVLHALDWTVAATLGAPDHTFWPTGTCGPTFACAANGGHPCAWGAVAALRALTAVPVTGADHSAAIESAVALLLSRDPLVADYPTREPGESPSPHWWRLGFPSGYAADVLDCLSVLAAAGHGGDPRLAPALDWLVRRQVAPGRWANRRRYRDRTTVDLDPEHASSGWVTVRACSVLRAAYG